VRQHEKSSRSEAPTSEPSRRSLALSSCTLPLDPSALEDGLTHRSLKDFGYLRHPAIIRDPRTAPDLLAKKEVQGMSVGQSARWAGAHAALGAFPLQRVCTPEITGMDRHGR